MATIFISALLLVGVVLAVRNIIKNRGRCASCGCVSCDAAQQCCAKCTQNDLTREQE
jgi:hypothetical protein